jgi:hypothetical protein
MKSCFILIVSILLQNQSFALEMSAPSSEDCSPVNLTAKKQIYNGIPTYDQGGGQICFAYTAAQLIEGQRVQQGHKYKKSESINPLSLALSLAIAAGAKDLQQGGVACEAVEHARKNLICPSTKSFSSPDEIERLIIDFKNCKNSSSKKSCEAKLEKLKLNKDVLLQDNPLLYVREIENSRCSEKDKIKLDIPSCINENDESKSSNYYRKKVDTVFNSESPRPVEIGFSMNLLSYTGNENKKYIIERTVEPDGNFFSLKYKPHSSILLGRKMGKNGQCQYLLRNTQGSEFCPMGIVERLGWECDTKSGGIWINQKELFESTFQVSNIEEDKKVGTLVNEFININKPENSIKCQQ